MECNGFREHLYDVSMRKDEFFFVASSQSHLLKLGKLVVKENAFYWFPDTPLGYHWSIHDADETHAKGRIHIRLDRTKGVLKRLPGGESLGTQVVLQEIPPFLQIKDIIPVGSEYGMAVS